ncbi:COG2847 Copper(I)-binding protein [Rhabdaerophilaceae bacterium]
MITSFFRGLALATALFLSLPAASHDYKIGDLKIDHPWSRATPGGAKVAGGFMTITNLGATPDRLIGGSVAAASNFEVHEMKMEGNVMKMRALEKGLEIKPGETVALKPGGFHVMFINLSSPLREGSTIKGTLVFERAGTVEVEFKVEGRGSSGENHGGHKH